MKEFTHIPITDELSNPPYSGMYQLYKNWFWVVDENNCILLYNNKTPQCNSDERVMELLASRNHFPEKIQIVKLENVYLKHDCNDYI